MGHRTHRRNEYPCAAGSLPDLLARGMGVEQRRRHPARLGDADRDTRVRRAHHHGAVLVQGSRQRRAPALCGRRGALRSGRRHRGQPRDAAPGAQQRQEAGAGALGLSHQAFPRRQRRRPRHPGVRGAAAAASCPGRLRRRRRIRCAGHPGRDAGRRPADAHLDRRGRPGRAVARPASRSPVRR